MNLTQEQIDIMHRKAVKEDNKQKRKGIVINLNTRIKFTEINKWAKALYLDEYRKQKQDTWFNKKAKHPKKWNSLSKMEKLHWKTHVIHILDFLQTLVTQREYENSKKVR